MRKTVFLMCGVVLCLMGCSKSKGANSTDEEVKTPYQQREALYLNTFEGMCEDWGVKEWIDFQKKDMRAAIAFYESNPSVEDAYQFITMRNDFMEQISNYNINEDAYYNTKIGRNVIFNKDFAADAEAVKLLDRLVRVQNPWRKAHGKEYDRYKRAKEREMSGEEPDVEEEVIVEEVLNAPTPEQLAQIKAQQIEKAPEGFKQALREDFYVPVEW